MFLVVYSIQIKSYMTCRRKITVSVLILPSQYTPQPFSLALFDLYLIICRVFLLSTLSLYYAFIGNTVWITRLSLEIPHSSPLLSSPLVSSPLLSSPLLSSPLLSSPLLSSPRLSSPLLSSANLSAEAMHCGQLDYSNRHVVITVVGGSRQWWSRDSTKL